MPAEEQWNGLIVREAEVLYRHLAPCHWIKDNGTGEYRLASGYLKLERGDDGISAYSATLLDKHGFKVEDILPADNYGYVELTVGTARQLGYSVVPDPNDERPVNIAHMLIKLPDGIQLSNRERRDWSLRLAQQVTIMKLPVSV